MSAAATPKPRTTVWHMEPVAANGSANLVAHARGESRSEVTEAANAVDAAARERGIVDLGCDTRADIAEDAKARKAWLASRRGQSKPFVEFGLAGRPQYGDERRWDDEKELAWAKAARQTGKPFGLARGNRGSKAKHQPVDQVKAAAAHAHPACGPCSSVGSATNARKALF